MFICMSCGVEYDSPLPDVCPICKDERHSVPPEGQVWKTLHDLSSSNRSIEITQLEDHLLGFRSEPKVGIGQTSLLATSSEGSLLWDPLGYLDDNTLEVIRSKGPVLGIAASHPHMFGVQIEWSKALDNAPVFVNSADSSWLGRRSDAVTLWDRVANVGKDINLHRIGGHFPGSAVAVWGAGAKGRGVLLAGDTIFPNPDRKTVGILRSYPTKIPLSGKVVERMAKDLNALEFDRVYGNVANTIPENAKDSIKYSAQRYIEWVRGDYDHLT